MSSTLLYRSIGIKIDDKRFIPVIEAGSSNVYEANNRRRARDWQQCCQFAPKCKPTTIEAILTGIADEAEYHKQRYTEFRPNSFGWYAGVGVKGKKPSNTTLADYKGFYTSAYKNRNFTIEEWKEENVMFVIRSSSYGDYEKHNKTRKTKYLETTEELNLAITEFTDYYANTGITFYLDVSGIERYFNAKRFDNMMNRLKPKTKS